MTWSTVHQGKLVHLPQVLAIATLPLRLATVLHHPVTATTLHRGSKVLLASKARLPRRLLSCPVLMEKEQKIKVLQRECQEHFAGHQALSRYLMARVEM